MKKFALAGLAAATLLAVPALAVQQGPARQGAQPLTRAAMEARVQAQFARTDANRDGFVTQAEAQAQAGARPDRAQRQAKRAERLARFDTDRDGTISQAERQAHRASRGPLTAEQQAKRAERRAERLERRGDRQALRGNRGLRLGQQRFARVDTNKDGRISLAEATARALVRFERLDADRDGAVTREERRTARANRQARRNG